MMDERRTGQEALFYEFSLERHAPADHLLRRIDQVVDLSGLRTHFRPFYSEIGRSSICPELMIRMLIVGYCLGTLDDAAWGAASEVTPKFVSRSDPAAQWTGALKGHAFFAYATNYLIDLDHAVIVDVEASAIRQAEVGSARSMIARTQDRFGLWPARLAADSAYGSAENLAWLVHEREIEPHIPVFDKSERRDGTFSRSEFTYDHARDRYTCPAGRDLKPRQRVYQPSAPLVDEDGMVRYRASTFDCDPCELKARCTPNMPARKILRSVHENARDMARDLALTDEYVTSRRQRKKVEMLFAHLKRIPKLDRLRLRGPNGARDEFHLAAAAQNLRKPAKLVPMPTPAPA